jgi:hypothetical protein
MNAADLKYIANEANRIEQGSIKRVSCADIRALLADRQMLLEALETIARLETSQEYDARTNGEGMSGDDAVSALSRLITQSRSAISKATT